MSQRIRTKTRKNRTLTYLWIFGLALLVGLLIWFDQIAILYVFSTLGVTALLVIVATADLGHSELSSGDRGQSPGTAPSRSTK
jgi:amino acid permease